MAVKSKTATPEVPADENTIQLAAAKASRDAFAAAQALAIKRQTEHDDAELAEAEMEGQFNRGIDLASASDYATVQAEVTRPNIRLKGPRRRAGSVAKAVLMTVMRRSWSLSSSMGESGTR